MVTLEELEALDILVWKRTGLQVSMALGCNQSTVSRRLARAVDLFGLALQRRRGEWQVRGGLNLLTLERQLHQHCRLLGRQFLRLEISPLLAPLLASPPPPGWRLGTLDHIGIARPLQLLRERVIDAWLIDNSLDMPPPDDPTTARFDLFRYPLLLAADARHPLAGVRGLCIGDLARFPVPMLPPDEFPHSSRRLSAFGLGGLEVISGRYDPADWEGRTRDGATLAIATPSNLALYGHLRPLATEPLFWNGISLVCHRDLREHAQIAVLREQLASRLRQHALAHLEPIS
jgi:DNA-binding transcriptional LysR family regulator